MAAIAIYDINSFVKNDSQIVALAGHVMAMSPTIGYGDSTPPFIIYYYSPNVPSVESFWMRTDSVLYSLYDTNMDRMLDISERIIDLLCKGDNISQTNGAVGTNSRILSTEFRDTSLTPPDEKDGWYKVDLEFVIHHVKK